MKLVPDSVWLWQRRQMLDEFDGDEAAMLAAVSASEPCLTM